MVQTGPRFADRGAALKAVVDAVASADGVGKQPAVLVMGETGAGKTRFLSDVACAARGHGIAAVSVRASRSDYGAPLAVAVDAAVDAAALAEEDGGVRTLIEELRQADAGHEIRLLATRVFDSLQRRGPVVLLVDDLAWADDGSAELLLRLVERPAAFPLVLVASQRIPPPRPRPPMEELFDTLERNNDVLRVELAPLTDDELADMVVAMLDSDPDAELVPALRALTGGNPFLADQVMQGWVEAGAVTVDRSGARLVNAAAVLPKERRDRILVKVLEHEGDEWSLAGAASLLGADRVDLLAAVTGEPLSTAAAAIDSLVERSVLVDEDGSLVFARPVVRDAIRQGIGRSERWRLQRAAVDWLSARPPSSPIAFELAELVARVAEPGDGRAIAQLVRAADLAHDSDPNSAVRWYGAALDLMPRDHLERPLVLSRLSRALFVGGRLSGSLEVGRAALAVLPPGEDQRRSEYLVTEAFIANTMETLSEEGIEFLRAQRQKRPDDLRLLAATAHVLARAGRVSEAEEALAPTATLDQRAEVDDWVIARVHLARANGLLAHYDDMYLEIERVLAAVDTASFQAQLVALCYFSFMLAEHGDPRADEFIARAAEVQERSHWDLWQTELELARVLDDHRAGRWDSALARIDAVTPRFESAGSVSRLSITRAVAVDIHANRGAWSAARRIDCEGLASRTFEELRLWATANVDLLVGDNDAARLALEQGVTGATTPRGREMLLARLGAVYLNGGFTDKALTAVEHLVAGRPIAMVSLPVLDAWRVYGAAIGDDDLLAQSLAEAERRGAPLLQGTIRLERVALGVDPEGNLREAYGIFHELGADPWRRRAAARLRAAGLKVPRHRHRAPMTLTDAEFQVARLVQEGRRNREIAQALCMSVKTVEAYLTRIYVKTNCSSRIELARALDQSTA